MSVCDDEEFDPNVPRAQQLTKSQRASLEEEPKGPLTEEERKLRRLNRQKSNEQPTVGQGGPEQFDSAAFLNVLALLRAAHAPATSSAPSSSSTSATAVADHLKRRSMYEMFVSGDPQLVALHSGTLLAPTRAFERQPHWKTNYAPPEHRDNLNRLMHALDHAKGVPVRGQDRGLCRVACTQPMKDLVAHWLLPCTQGKNCPYPECREAQELYKAHAYCETNRNVHCPRCGKMIRAKLRLRRAQAHAMAARRRQRNAAPADAA